MELSIIDKKMWAGPMNCGPAHISDLACRLYSPTTIDFVSR